MVVSSGRELSSKMVFVWLGLLAVVSGLIGLLFMIPPSDSQFVGICLIIIGGFQILFHKAAGRRAYGMGRRMPFVSNQWDRAGIRGAQVLYLGIGISCALAGAIFLLKLMSAK
jgi:hypothetical protein